MKLMKKMILLTLAVFFIGHVTLTYAKNNTDKTPAKTNTDKVSKYEYKDNDVPAVCFFPAEKARWNGYTVKTNEWEKLNDYQRTMFISEGVEEIKRVDTGKVTVNIQEDGGALLVAMNNRMERLQVEFPGVDEIAIKFLREILKEMGKIKG